MVFLVQYWSGQISLPRSFWIYFILPGACYHFIEPYLFLYFQNKSSIFIFLASLYLILTRLLIFPWQIIGLLRANEKYYMAHRQTILLHAVQFIVVLSIIGTVVHITNTVQLLLIYKKSQINQRISAPKAYPITLKNKNQLLFIKGTLDFGITREVEELLNNNPSVRNIVLESTGGQIYEGRGLGLLFDRYQLDTYSFSHCMSACTSAFIGGSQRYLGVNARLGFHQYSYDSNTSRLVSHPYDLKAEQKKDLAIYKAKNIDKNFLNRLFDAPGHEMWYPTPDELIASGVIDGVIPNIDVVIEQSATPK